MKRIGDHKQYNTIRLFTILLTVVSLLIASPLLQADDDIEVEGPIQAIGSDSLIVTGITFFVDANTEIHGPNGPIGFSDLMVGHYVEVEAELQSNGTYLADQIELEDDIEVEGVIQDIGSDSLIVMGVIFFVDANTEIRDSHGNPISFSDLQVGDFVEVEADLQPDGTYLATRIELEDDGEEIEVEGHIEAIGADSVVVNSIVFFVDSSTVILDDDNNPISFSDLEVGDEVEITAILRPDGTYLATRIKLEDDELGEIEVEGHIEAIGADSVVVNSIVFFVNSSTVILDDDNNPISLSDLGVGDEVEITAILRPDGTYLATRIKLEDDELEEIEITAPIDTLFGDSIGVAGIIFWTDSNTLILDDHGQPISFSDLQNGMIVEIRGEIQPDGSIYATRIKVEDFFQDEIEVEGFIDSLGTDHLLVRGITFYVDANTLVLNENNQPIQFSDLAVGLKVEVRANLQADGTLLTERIKVEDHNNNNELELQAVIDGLGANSVIAAGVEFLVDAHTLILDQSGNPITFNDLSVGLTVEIKALQQPDGSFLATRIKIEDSPGFSMISGTVVTVMSNTIVVSRPQFQVLSSTVVLDEDYRPVPYSNITVGQNVTLWSDASAGGHPVALQIKMTAGNNPTDLGDNSGDNLPQRFELGQNYPNPFNPSTIIPVTIKGKQWQQAELHIYNILGEKVHTLFYGLLNGGSYEFTWNGLDQQGNAVASGIYFYQLIIDSQLVNTRRMVLLK